MEVVDYTGQVCPYPVVLIIEAVEKMVPGEIACFAVDDPLAVKSIPEELEDFSDIGLSVEKDKGRWLVTVSRNS